MKIKFCFFLFLLLPLIYSCSDQQQNALANNNEVVTVATFNIQWLGDGKRDAHKRKSSDYKRIAKIIRESEADIVALQEIENGAAIDIILRYLSGYKYFIADCTGAQNVAVLYDSIVSVKLKRIYTPLQLGHTRYRPGLEIEVKAGNFDFVAMIVHLKASSNFERNRIKKTESIANRTLQNVLLSNWLDSSLAASKEKDYIILGDFNDSPSNDESDAFEPLLRNKHIRILTEDLKSSGKFSGKNVIDHIVVSTSAFKRCNIASLMLFDISKQYTDKQLANISDHAPVLVQFDIKAPDKD